MRKKILSLVMAIMMIAGMACGFTVLADASASDYYVRNLMATANNVSASNLRVSWVNPTNTAESIELYKVTGSGDTLLTSVTDKTPGKFMVYNCTAADCAANETATFRIVSTFADGTVIDQITSGTGSSAANAANASVQCATAGNWIFSRSVNNAATGSIAGSWTFTYDGTDPVLKLTSTDDGWKPVVKAQLNSPTVSGHSYRFSYKYKLTNPSMSLYLYHGSGNQYKNLVSTTSTDWVTVDNTASAGSIFTIEMKSCCEEMLIKDLTITDVTDAQNPVMLNDGGFQNLAAANKTAVSGLNSTYSAGQTTVSWNAVASPNVTGVRIYETLGGSKVLRAEVSADQTSVVFNNADENAEYTASTVYMGYAETTELDRKDCCVRNLMATANNVSASNLRVSWVNPTNTAESIELYKVTGSGDTLLTSVTDKTPGKFMVYNCTAADCAANETATFRIVSTFANGTVIDQITSGTGSSAANAANASVQCATAGNWIFSRSVNNAATGSIAGSWTFTYDGTDPVLKLTSTDDGWKPVVKAQLNSPTVSSHSYRFSYKYKLTNPSMSLYLYHGNGNKYKEIVSTTSTDWVTVDNTAGAGSIFTIEMKSCCEEMLIKDLMITDVTDAQTPVQVNDGGLATLASSGTASVTGAYSFYSNGHVTVGWDATSASKIRVYENSLAGDILRAEVTGEAIQTVLNNANENSTYYVETLNANGAFSEKTMAEQVDEIPAVYTNLYPQDLMASSTGVTGQILVSWKNPTSGDIRNITLYDGFGSVIKSDCSIETGAVQQVFVDDLDDGVVYGFRLVATAADGCTSECYTEGISAISESAFSDIDGWVISRPYSGPEGLRAPITMKITTEDAASGNACMKITDNLIQRLPFASPVLSAANVSLQAGTTYTLSYKIKGGQSWGPSVVTWDKKDLAGGSDSWKTVTETISTEGTANGALSFVISHQSPTIYLDDISIKAQGSNEELVTNGGFEEYTANNSEALNLSAAAGECSAAISWEMPTDSAVTGVNVYQSKKGTTTLAASFKNRTAAHTFANLQNGVKHTFIVKTVNSEGIESEGVSVEVTPVSPASRIGAFILSQNDNIVTASQIAAGTYDVNVDIKNNKEGNNYTAELIVALYDGVTLCNVSATGIENIPQTADTETPVSLNASITVPDTTGHNYRVKAFLWRSLEEMKSLKSSVEFFK